jgi:putative aldouronate transport system permease protein
MSETVSKRLSAPDRLPKKKKLWIRMVRNRWLYLLAAPGIVYYLLFRYAPMWGLIIAFQKYNPPLGLLKSPWAGFEHFADFFSNPDFVTLFTNTIMIALNNLVFFFPLPIILALMLNSVASQSYKRVIQTITYMPHFLSWVIIASISYVMLTTEGGIIHDVVYRITGQSIPFLTGSQYLRPLIVFQAIWRETGWGTIIFLAALSNVDQELYDAAHVDGANGWQRMIHITLPAISGTIVTLLILRLGHFLDTGFEQLFLMTNALNRNVGDVFDTFVYRVGIQNGQYSYTAAVGLFKSLVGLILVLLSDRLAKLAGSDGIL